MCVRAHTHIHADTHFRTTKCSKVQTPCVKDWTPWGPVMSGYNSQVPPTSPYSGGWQEEEGGETEPFCILFSGTSWHGLIILLSKSKQTFVRLSFSLSFLLQKSRELRFKSCLVSYVVSLSVPLHP